MSAVPVPAAFPVASPVAFGPSLAKARRSEVRFAAEVLAFPARWLGELPLPPSFGMHVAGVPGVVRVVFGEGLSEDVSSLDEVDVVFSADEWSALCRGVEADRIWPGDMAAFCARKLANPAYRLEMDEALAGVVSDKSECWALSRVLERVDAHLVSV